MVLREIKAFSCDSNWNPSFNTDDTMCFKQIHLESLSVYLDYNVEVINILKFYNKKLETSFENFITDDFNSAIQHNYLIQPFSLTAKLSFCKEKENFVIPLIHANIIFHSFMLNFYVARLKIISKFLTFFKLHQAFRLGIKVTEQSFDENEENIYRTIYRN